jgi:hypothetical protein
MTDIPQLGEFLHDSEAVPKQRAVQENYQTTENVQRSTAATWLIFDRRYSGLIAACRREEILPKLEIWQPLFKFPFPTRLIGMSDGLISRPSDFN